MANTQNNNDLRNGRPGGDGNVSLLAGNPIHDRIFCITDAVNPGDSVSVSSSFLYGPLIGLPSTLMSASMGAEERSKSQSGW